MAEPKKVEEGEKRPSAQSRIYRHNSATRGSDDPKAQQGSYSGGTQGQKDSQKKATAVGGKAGALLVQGRGELLDPGDNLDLVRSHPPWEEDLNKYLPDTQAYMHPWNPLSAAGPSTSSQPIAFGLKNVASSSKPPMIPFKETGNITVVDYRIDLSLQSSHNNPQSQAAIRWHQAYQMVKRQNKLKRKAMRSPLGTGAKVDGHAFGLIPEDDETRLSMFNFWYQSYPLALQYAEYWLACLIAGHIIVLCLKAEIKFVRPYIPSREHLNNADIALTSLFTLEILSRMFALGCCKGPHTYLRHPYNKLDFVIVVDSWVHIARTCILGKDAFIRIAIFRLFRILLSARHLKFFGNILAIMDAIGKSLWQLKTIFVFTIMIMSFYSLLGVTYMGGLLRRRCVRIADNQVTYPPRTCKFRHSKNVYGYQCGPDQVCQPDYGNPNWGVTSFDNYASGMLLLFQMMTVEGWGVLMSDFNHVTGYSNIFFCVYIVVGSYFIINVYIAAVSSIFLRVRQEHQAILKKHHRDKELTLAAASELALLFKDSIARDDAKVNLTWRQRFSANTSIGIDTFRRSLVRQGKRLHRSVTKAIDWEDPNSYLRRISTFGLPHIDAVDMEEVGQRPILQSFRLSLFDNLSMRGQRAARLGRSISRNLSMGVINAAQTTSGKCALVVESKVFLYATLVLISLNMAGLCTYKAHMSPRHERLLEIMEIGFLVIFVIEMGLRLVASGGFAAFVDERINIFDVLVIAISSGATGFGPTKKYPNMTPIRMFRWFYKKNIHNEDIGKKTSVVGTIIQSSEALMSVFFFLTLVILVYAMAGMELWGGQFSDFPEGYPRANFDSIFQAMLLWFSVTTAESWPNAMWNTMRPGVPYKWMGPIMFVTCYVISAIVTLNLLMAVLLEKTELTDNQKKFIQKREHIKRLQTKRMHHASSRSSDWLVGAVQGAHKGYKGLKKRMSTISVSRFPTRIGFLRMSSSPSSSQGGPPTGETVLPRRSPQEPLAAIPLAARAPVRSSSGSPAVDIPGTIGDPQGEDRTERRQVLERSRSSVLSSVNSLHRGGLGSQMRRRPSFDADKVVLRNGFRGGLTMIAEGEGRTALQTALLNVVQDQNEISKIEELEKSQVVDIGTSLTTRPVDLRLAKPALEIFPSKREHGPRISFVLADYDAIKPQSETTTLWWLSERSLFIFAPDDRFRLFCTKVAENSFYLKWQYLMIWLSMFIILEQDYSGYVISAVVPTVANEGFFYSHPFFLDPFDYFVLAAFSLDFVMKVVANGFLFTPEAYLGDPFNFIDLFSLVVHICKTRNRRDYQWVNRTIILSASRPARLIVRSSGLRALTASICRTLPAIGHMFCFALVIFAIFAVIGMQLFANRFRFCSDPSVTGHVDCVGFYQNYVGVLDQRTWQNPSYHFDSFGDAMLALFVLSTLDNWLDYFAYTSMDVPDAQELQPRQNSSPSHIIFVVSFVCIGGFITLRMFIGIFIDEFGMISGSKLLTERQKLWRDINHVVQYLQPTRLPQHPTGVIRGFGYRVVNSRRFELLITYVILINYGFIAYQHFVSEDRSNVELETFDKVEAMFVSVYLLEALVKLLGTKCTDWWHQKWNLAELVLVMASACCLFPNKTGRRINRTYARQFGQFFYLLRIFRIFRYVLPLSNIASTILRSLPDMVNIMALMGILLFLFAGIGTFQFHNLRQGVCYGDFLSDITLGTFTQSFVLLFQLTTLDNWSCILRDMTVQQPYCVVTAVPQLSCTCGDPVGSIVFVLVLVSVSSHIFANLFIAQIIDSISFGLLDEKTVLVASHLYQYQHLWAQPEFDHYCTGYIGHHKLKEFVKRLGPPLGLPNIFQTKWTTKIEYEALNFRSPKGIPFRSLLETLVLYKIGPRGLELPLRLERERQIQILYRTGAAIKIQALGRGHLQRKGFYNNQTVKDEEVEPVQSEPQGIVTKLFRATSTFFRR